MPKHYEKKIVDFSAKQMFDLVLDIETYPAFIKWCSSARITKIIDEKSFFAQLQIAFNGIREEYVSLVVFDDKSLTISVEGTQGPFNHLNNKWSFIDLDKNTCVIEFNLDFEIKSKILSKVMNLVFFPAVKSMVVAFEKRAEVLYSKK